MYKQHSGARIRAGVLAVAILAPPLDAAGNSVKAQKTIADISNAPGGNPYAPKPVPAKVASK